MNRNLRRAGKKPGSAAMPKASPAAQQAFVEALGFHQAGQLDQAEGYYRQALAADPNHTDSLHLLGVIAYQRGSYDLALDLIAKAIRGNAKVPLYHSNLGLALQAVGRLSEAIASYRQAISLDRTFPLAHNNLGNALKEHGQTDDAAACYRRAIALKADFAEAHTNLGFLLHEHQGLLDEAIACHRRALALEPRLAVAHNNLGVALQARGEPNQAADSYGRALELNPTDADAYSNLGVALRAMGRPEDAIACYRKALDLKPDFAAAHSMLIFTLESIGTTSSTDHQTERRRWYDAHARRFAPAIITHDNDADPERPLKIGYVSADFRNHSAVLAFGLVLREHNPANVMVHAYSEVKPGQEDEVTRRLRSYTQVWRSIAGKSDDEVAAMIRGDGIDILIDLSGHTTGNRLLVFARKPAPVQITAWGYVTGTGLPQMDAILADSAVIPMNERHLFAERVVDLPSALCYEGPEDPPPVPPLPALTAGCITFGSFNRLTKIDAHCFALWASILKAVPGSKLLFKDRQLDREDRRHWLSGIMAANGIDASRLILLGGTPYSEHLAAFGRVDIALDPFPCNGGITTMDGLLMGVPTVTLRGGCCATRAGASINTALGLQAFIAETVEGYVEIAVKAANDLPALTALRAGLRQRLTTSPIGDRRAYTQATEAIYRSLWREWCKTVKVPETHTESRDGGNHVQAG